MTNQASGAALAADGWIATAPPALLRAAPALAALVYPLLVWSGPAIWPPLLATALLSPAIAVWAVTRRELPASPAARRVALAAVAAPPAYTLLGALLDFQHTLPFSGITVWIPVWLGLAALAAWRLPAHRRPPTQLDSGRHIEHAGLTPARARRPVPRALATAHGISALPIIAFALAHIVNQASGAISGATHIAIMTSLRAIYRHPYLEPVLFACIATQVITGIILVCNRTRPLARLDHLQRAAGVYLAVFFCSHLNAVLRARFLRGTNTDWHWLSAYKLDDPWCARLGPYYALAVIALATHLAGAIRTVAIGHGARSDRWTWLFALSIGLASVAATMALVGITLG